MSKSEVNRLRSIRQYLLIGLSFLFSGGIALLAYSPSNGLTVSYGFIIALALGLNVLLIYQIQVIWTEINRRVQSEKMIQALMTKREELEKELRALYAEKEQENVDTRNADQLLEDLVSEVQGSEFQTYISKLLARGGNLCKVCSLCVKKTMSFGRLLTMLTIAMNRISSL